jgi:NAD(P)-dependent dehydrogenase (short-subunit alcohol dehydrogenase family)
MTEKRVAVVTGAGSGIGRAMAARFATEGLRVVLADVDADAVSAAARELGGIGVRTDVSRAEDLAALRDRALAEYGRVDIVCNNAGVTSSGRIKDITLADWQWVLGINLWGVIHGVDAFLPTLIANPDGGHIINTASGAGLVPAWATGPYSVSKYGIVSLSEVLRTELAQDAPNVAVSVLVPTATATNIVDTSKRHAGGVVERQLTELEAEREQIKRERLGAGMTPEAVADAMWQGVVDRRFWILAAAVTADWVMDRALEIKAAAPAS